MVFFVCETCNETLKKNQVEKHVFKCRNCQAVTCVDCSVTFYGNDYEQHISCVSEAEKYEKTLYKAKKVKLNPQDAWVALIEDVTSRVKEAPVAIQQHLTRLGELSNVPRNKKKFINFCQNSLKLYNDKILEGLWDHLEKNRLATIAAESKPEPVVTKAPVAEDVVASAEEVVSDEKKEKKEKKSKKSKKEHDEPVAEVKAAEEAPVEETKDKKKHKKEKKDTKEAEEIVVEVEETAVEEVSEDKKKKSKKRKHESDSS